MKRFAIFGASGFGRVMWLVHPTLTPEEIVKTAEMTALVLAQASGG